MFTLNTSIKYCCCLIRTSGLSLLVVSFVVVTFWTKCMCDWHLFHPLILLNHFEFLLMRICHDILLLSCQIVIITAWVANQTISSYWWFDQQYFITQWTELHFYSKIPFFNLKICFIINQKLIIKHFFYHFSQSYIKWTLMLNKKLKIIRLVILKKTKINEKNMEKPWSLNKLIVLLTFSLILGSFFFNINSDLIFIEKIDIIFVSMKHGRFCCVLWVGHFRSCTLTWAKHLFSLKCSSQMLSCIQSSSVIKLLFWIEFFHCLSSYDFQAVFEPAGPE